MKKWCCIVILVVFLVGCRAEEIEQPEPTATAQATKTLVPTSTARILPTITTTLVPTNTVTPTKEITNTPKPTRVPTLNPETIVDTILTGLKTNNNSPLPSILNLTVNQSTNYDKNNVLAQYPKLETEDIVIVKEAFGLLQYIPNQETNGQQAIWIIYDFDFQDDDLVCTSFKLSYHNSDDYSIVYGDDYFSSISDYYQLRNIMHTYGEPSQVYVYTLRFEEGNYSHIIDVVPFYVIIYYEKAGFAIQYTTVARLVEPNFIVGDMAQSNIDIWAWDPEIKLIVNENGTSNQVCKYLGFMPHNNYQSLETVNSMGTKEFFEWIISSDAGPLLLYTPEELWYPIN